MTIRLPNPPPDNTPMNRWAASLALVLGTFLDRIDTAKHTRGAILPLAIYAKADLPDAASNPGGMIYVTDDVGGAVPAFSDGTDWRRVTDRAIVA